MSIHPSHKSSSGSPAGLVNPRFPDHSSAHHHHGEEEEDLHLSAAVRRSVGSGFASTRNSFRTISNAIDASMRGSAASDLVDLDVSTLGTGQRASGGGGARRSTLGFGSSMVDIFLATDDDEEGRHFGGMEKQRQPCCAGRNLVLLGCAIVALAALLVLVPQMQALGITTHEFENATAVFAWNASDVPDGTAPPQATRWDALLHLVTRYIPMEELASTLLPPDDSSANYRALQWIADADPAHLPVPGFGPGLYLQGRERDEFEQQVLQRFALAAFYYSVVPQAKNSTTTTAISSILTNNSAKNGTNATAANVNTTSSSNHNNNNNNHSSIRRLRRIETNANDVTAIEGEEYDVQVDFSDILNPPPVIGKDQQLRPSAHHVQLENHLKFQQGWLVADHVCTWHGILCHTADNSKKTTLVRALQLTAHGLSGTLPRALMLLSDLEIMDLSVNFLKGAIPGVMANPDGPRLPGWPHMTALLLNNNTLTGSVPYATMRTMIPALYNLQLSHNQFTGDLPFGAGSDDDFGALRHLQMRNNQFSGSLEPLVNAPRLQTCDLAMNHLTKPIPDSLAELEFLTELHLDENDLDGQLPASFGKLGKLQTIVMDNNKLTGTLPSEWSSLKSLVTLKLISQHKLGGSLPPSWGDLSELRILWLESNELLGPVPSEWSKLEQLEELRLRENKLSGTVPDAVCALRHDHNLHSFSANCKSDMVCTCCTQCF